MLTIIDEVPANSRYTVEAGWITEAGLPAVIIIGRQGFRCGYVAVPKTSPLYGIMYNAQIPQITKAMTEQTTLGMKSPILALTAGCGADDEDSLRRSLDVIIDVHGGLTYSRKADGYPVRLDKPGWWFGYDCGHYGDDHTGGQPNWYCSKQCESLAKQLAAFV
jgi:hypothetical protein